MVRSRMESFSRFQKLFSALFGKTCHGKQDNLLVKTDNYKGTYKALIPACYQVYRD